MLFRSWPPVMDSPSDRVPEQAPERFLVATEACGGGTLDLSCSSMFLGHVDLYRRKKSVGGASRRPGDRSPPYWARPLSHGPLEHLPTDFFRLYSPTYPKNIHEEDRSGVPPLQASVATKNLSGALPGTLPKGGSFTGGHLHHPGALHDEEGVVHPQG